MKTQVQKLFEETAVEISYVGITDKQGKLRTIYPTKKVQNEKHPL